MMVESLGRGRSFGACGEFVQGFLGDGTPFHVTCPINLFSEVEVRLTHADEFEFIGFRPDTEKMRRACERILEWSGAEPLQVTFTRRSSLESGKGMASSTADIVAISRAVSDALGRDIDSTTLAKVAASIERSDGIMYCGVNAVDHVTGDRIKNFNWYPDYSILMCVPPETFDTANANLNFERRSKPHLDNLLNLLEEAARDRNSRSFSEISTESARLNQRYRFSGIFSLLEKQLVALGAEGACIAHTGTVVGLLFGGADAATKARLAVDPVARLLPHQVRLQITKLSAGLR